MHDAQSHTVAEMNVIRGTVEGRTVVEVIAGNVIAVREACRVTRKEMAKALGITASTLWRKETAGTEFKGSELIAIAGRCGVDVSRLLRVPAATDNEDSAYRASRGLIGTHLATSPLPGTRISAEAPLRRFGA